jgi:hypothetical protein
MKIAATMIDKVDRSAVTDDGRHVALTLRQSCGNLTTLGLPGAELPDLIDHAARAMSDRRRLFRDEDGHGTIAVTWWNVRRDCRSGDLVLCLTFGSGGSLDFALTERMASCLMDTLRFYVGSGSAGHGQTPENRRGPQDLPGGAQGVTATKRLRDVSPAVEIKIRKARAMPVAAVSP